MSVKAYLITLTNRKDTQTILINEAAWEYLNNASDGRAIPDELIRDFVELHREGVGAAVADSALEDEAREVLAWNDDSGSADNDIAMAMGGSLFGGRRWNHYNGSTKALADFIKRYDLVIEGEFDGCIY